MTSEIRANIIKNRVGLGTIEYSNTGPIITGVTTASNFKTGSSNLHSSGIEIAGINVLGADTTIGSGVTIYNSGAAVYTGVVTGTTFVGNLTGNVTGNATGLSGTPNLSAATGTFTGDLTIPDKIVHTGDTDTTIRFSGTDTISMETAGTERLRIDSTGRVMIATTVAGTNSDLTIGDASSGSTGRIRIRSASNGGGYIDFQDTTGNTVDGSIEYNHVLNSFNFYFGSQERFRIHTQGMLGLSGANYGTSGQVLTSGGTGSPVSWTTITGTTINNNADNRVITGSGTANTLNGESGVTIDGSNILAISGTGQQQLNVGSTNAGGAAIVLDGDSNGDGAGGDYSLIRHNTSGDLEFYARNGSGATNTIFKQGTTEKFRMGNDGNLTISDGDLVIASGPHGIDFSADSSGTLQTLAGSLNAELLHDYEVGTFTPNIQYDTGTNQYYGSPGSGHYVASSKGEYIRIGDMMYAAGQITLTGNRNSTQTVHISIGGMPYNGLHSSQQNSLMTGWGGAAWPKNDSNSSFRLYYSYHNYTTLNFAFKQTAGNNGIDGFNFHVYYRCTT